MVNKNFERADIWFKFAAVFLSLAFITITATYSIFLFNNSDVITIWSMTFIYNRIQYFYIGILLFYAFFLILYFMMGIYSREKKELQEFKDWRGVLGAFLSLMAFPLMLVSFAGIICWITGAVLSLYGLRNSFRHNVVAKFAFAGALFSAVSLYVLPYNIAQSVFFIFPGGF